MKLGRYGMGWLAMAMSVIVVTSCSPQAPAAPGTGGGADTPTAPRSTAPKTLNIAKLREPATIEGFTGEGGTAGGAGEAKSFLHAHLTEPNRFDQYLPSLATELPALDKGTLVVNPDGTMDVTWKLRAGVKWQDGAPFTSDDLAFSYMLHEDPALPTAYGPILSLLTSVETPDPLTFVVHWSRADYRVFQADGLTPMPRHLMEAPYQSDKGTFANSSLFTTDWIGLGPYRLTKWVQGSHMEMTRFDDYFLGRAPFDSINFYFYFDGNTMEASALAGALDVVLAPGIDLDAAVDMKQRWDGTVRIEPIPRLADMEIQFRQDIAKPVNGLRDRTVRQAFYQALNREELSGVMAHGLAPIADSWVPPNDPARAQVESAIPQYPFDLAAATRLLAQAGWVHGADGALVHQPDGEHFESQLVTIPQYGLKPAVVIANQWKALGADISVFAIPGASSADRSLQSTEPLALMTGSYAYDLPNRMDGRLLSTAANRWTGRNQSGWVNPAYDANLDRLASTLDPQARTALLREQQHILMDDIGRFELYWEVFPVLYSKEMSGDIFPYRTTFNFMDWTKQG